MRVCSIKLIFGL
nr:unnamed protein product [Callosobruchus analis]